MKFLLTISLVVFLALTVDGFAHGANKHSGGAASPKTASGEDLGLEAPMSQESERQSGHAEEQVRSPASVPIVEKPQPGKSPENPDKEKIEDARKKANDAVSSLKYRATMMALGAAILIGGLAVRYAPGKGGG